MALLTVDSLSIDFDTRFGTLSALRDVSFEISEGETLGIVGESGCGKSITSLAIMGLLPPTATIRAQSLHFNRIDLQSASEATKRSLRGGDLAMIFQDPMTSLNPSFTVEFQIAESLKVHGKLKKNELRQRTLELLDQVGIPDPESRLRSYPHELSGGMCQRVMIAMAIACRPRLLIADEPTTALDVTIQSQILDLLKNIQKETGMAMMLITHDIGVVAEMSRRIQVMYAGEVVETGQTAEVIARPRHPYTEALLKCLPSSQSFERRKTILPQIAGIVPNLLERSKGCQMAPRCSYVSQRCRDEAPVLREGVRCHFPVGDVGA